MYFSDMTAFSNGVLLDNAANVGWLCKQREYTRGTCSARVLRRLLTLAAIPMAPTAGLFGCEFCAFDGNIEIGGGKTIRLGSDLIVVPGIKKPRETQRYYIAPNLIYHYCEAHGYLPPSEFLLSLESMNYQEYDYQTIGIELFGECTIWRKPGMKKNWEKIRREYNVFDFAPQEW